MKNYDDYLREKAEREQQQREANKHWYNNPVWWVIGGIILIPVILHPILSFDVLVAMINPYDIIVGLVIAFFVSFK